MDIGRELLIALALVLVIEGSVWALFPDVMRRMMAALCERPPAELRIAGMVLAVVGVALAWLVRG